MVPSPVTVTCQAHRDWEGIVVPLWCAWRTSTLVHTLTRCIPSFGPSEHLYDPCTHSEASPIIFKGFFCGGGGGRTLLYSVPQSSGPRSRQLTGHWEDKKYGQLGKVVRTWALTTQPAKTGQWAEASVGYINRRCLERGKWRKLCPPRQDETLANDLRTLPLFGGLSLINLLLKKKKN